MNKDTMLDRATDGVAVGGVSSLWWWPNLEQVSNWAVQLVPILSVLWLAVQIIGYVRRMRAGQ